MLRNPTPRPACRFSGHADTPDREAKLYAAVAKVGARGSRPWRQHHRQQRLVHCLPPAQQHVGAECLVDLTQQATTGGMHIALDGLGAGEEEEGNGSNLE